MHNFVIRCLDPSIFGFEAAWWHFKKSFFEGPKGSHFKKKPFLKCYKATSNPDTERSKHRMTNLCISYGLYMNKTSHS